MDAVSGLSHRGAGMRIILGMTQGNAPQKGDDADLVMTVIFLFAFWFVAGTIGGDRRFGGGSGIMNGSILIERFTNGAFILTLGFSSDRLSSLFWRSSAPSRPLPGKRSRE